MTPPAMIGVRRPRRSDQTPVAIGIGLHHGPVTTGDIGGAQRFEFAVIGDTVNVANRLEELTRSQGTPLLISDAALASARLAGADVAGFVAAGEHRVRGRAAPLRIWSWRAGALVAAE